MAATEPPAHEIIVARTPEERQQCYDIRIAVFHHEQKFPLETEIDDKEDISTHFLLRLTPSLEPVGTIRTYTIPVPVPSDSSSTASSTSTSLPSANPGSTPLVQAQAYKLTRLAVLKGYRQFRFGRALVLALHEWVRKHALARLALTASSSSPSSVSGTSATATTERPPAAVTIVAHSQIPAKGFYARFGYEAEGAEFDEDGDPHQKMVLQMPLRPSAAT